MIFVGSLTLILDSSLTTVQKRHSTFAEESGHGGVGGRKWDENKSW